MGDKRREVTSFFTFFFLVHGMDALNNATVF